MSSANHLPKVFISYSHQDRNYLKRLLVHLGSLERNGLIDIWRDTKIVPGANWRNEIKEAIESAKVAVLLVSADFLASQFIAENELPPLLEAAKTKGTVILPVILSPCDMVSSNLSHFQAVNSPSNPLTKMNRHQREEQWRKVAGNIREIISVQNLSLVHVTNLEETSTASEEKLTKVEFVEKTVATPILSDTNQYKRPKAQHLNPDEEIDLQRGVPMGTVHQTAPSNAEAFPRFASTMEFIGRRPEIAFLTQWLADRGAPWIVYIHDAWEEKERKDGIGKSWLLRRLYELVEQQHKNVIPVVVDFFNVLDRDSVVIAERVVQAVRKRYPHWNAEDFDKLLQEYLQATLGQKAETQILRERLADALASDLSLLQQQMIVTDTYLLLFFDSYELIEHDPITAVLRPAKTFPDTYQTNRIRAVIAGRNAIDWTHHNWVGREQEVIVRTLPPLNYEEMMQYLQARLNASAFHELAPQTLQALYQKTEGRPILLGLVTDVLNKRIRDPETLAAIDRAMFEASLVEEINHFDAPSKWVIFSMAHIYHRFNTGFLDRLLNWSGLKGIVPEMRYRELVKELLALSFVRSSGENFVLHDEMRRLVNKYCWGTNDPDGRIRRELSSLAVNYYTELIDKEVNGQQRQSYIVEKLYHELFLDVETGFQSFQYHFNYAIDFSLRAFSRALLQELQKFEHQLSDEQRLTIKLAEVKVLCDEDNPAAALDILSSLEQHNAWVEQHRSDLLFEKGNCYMQLSQYPKSIVCFEACLEIEQSNRDQEREALLFNRLGYIHSIEGRYTEAMIYYEEALKVQRSLDNQAEYANLLNNMGNVLRLQGKLEDALRYCKLALRIRRDLLQQNRINEYYVGLSLSTLGDIYHALGDGKREEEAYQEAFEIYNRVGDKSAISSAYNCLGRVWLEKQDLRKASEYFQQAARIASGVSRTSEIESYNQLGHLSLVQEQWEEAIGFFEKVVALSRQVGLDFQLVENLLYLADSLDHVGRSSDELLKEAKRIARKQNYNDLLARAEEMLGDMYLRRHEYQRAFKHYRVACRHAALRGFPEFNRTLRKLNDTLLEIPAEYLPGVLESLLSYWYELRLDEEYPALPEICKEVSKFILL